jgi:hypothetical protein
MPEKTKTYCPVGHDWLIDKVQDEMESIGFKFADETHSLTKEGKRYFGLMQLANGTDHEDFALMMGVRNSMDKSFPAAISFGSHVFVCDNLAFSGEQVISRKHTPNIMFDLPGLIKAAVSQTKAMQHLQEQRFEFYQRTTIESDRFAHNLIIEMLRRGAVNTSRVERVVNEWHEPSYDHGEKTFWRLFNAATEALKGAPLTDMPGRTLELQALLDQASNFQPVIEGELAEIAA